MSVWKIFHNPRCSKSREALDILRENKIEPQIIEYLKTPPTESEILDLIDLLDGSAEQLVRTKEEQFKSLQFDLSSSKEIARHISMYPVLLERPIVVRDETAIVARPPEKLRVLLNL